MKSAFGTFYALLGSSLTRGMKMDRRKFIAAAAATGTGLAFAPGFGFDAFAQAAKDTVVVAQSGDALTMDPARLSHYPT
ncbi:MAG: twin-arginine translocation signal domain-containing protein, partial [Alphaproteobacteria bacterium]|nr:twin-arginine translocation signal domain-containing protein [Alphaproteobacteria bacterium]